MPRVFLVTPMGFLIVLYTAQTLIKSSCLIDGYSSDLKPKECLLLLFHYLVLNFGTRLFNVPGPRTRTQRWLQVCRTGPQLLVHRRSIGNSKEEKPDQSYLSRSALSRVPCDVGLRLQVQHTGMSFYTQETSLPLSVAPSVPQPLQH